ncbi:MAG: ABC transporter permease [Candidatus Marinamargulisbacteria bacterium]|jgi:peptide/nickel transport system permease protein
MVSPQIRSHRLAKLAMIYIGTLIVVAIGYPWVSSVDPTAFDPNRLSWPQPPSWTHLFGTDELNRDIFARIMIGSRVSLLVGFIAVGISSTIGTGVGLLSGYSRPFIDSLLMRFVDIMMAIPSIFIILTLQIILTPRIETVMAVIGLTSWMSVSRLVRAEVLKIKHQPFITAAKARGLSEWTIVRRYVLPQTIHPVLVASTLGIGYAILTEAVLSFLGLGVQPPNPSWGNMLQNSVSFMLDAPWMAIFPGVFITLTVVSFNLMGDYVQQHVMKQTDVNHS